MSPPRLHRIAVPLSNDQVAIIADDEPTDLIELFTPTPPTALCDDIQ